MIEYHDPTAPTQVENTPYTHCIAVSGEKIDLGFLANGFPDSENFLNELQQAIQAIEPGIRVHAWNKGNASIPAPADMLEEINNTCDAVIAAYGH